MRSRCVVGRRGWMIVWCESRRSLQRFVYHSRVIIPFHIQPTPPRERYVKKKLDNRTKARKFITNLSFGFTQQLQQAKLPARNALPPSQPNRLKRRENNPSTALTPPTKPPPLITRRTHSTQTQKPPLPGRPKRRRRLIRHRTPNLTQTRDPPPLIRRTSVRSPLHSELLPLLPQRQLPPAIPTIALRLADLLDLAQRRRGVEGGPIGFDLP